MRSQDDGDGVKKTKDDSKFDRIAKIDGQLATSVHGGQAVPVEQNERFSILCTLYLNLNNHNLKKCTLFKNSIVFQRFASKTHPSCYYISVNTNPTMFVNVTCNDNI